VNRLFSICLILLAALGQELTQRLTEVSARSRKIMLLRGRSRPLRCVRLTTLPQSVSRLSRQCGILNVSHPYRSPEPVTGITLLSSSSECSSTSISYDSSSSISSEKFVAALIIE
jgi:hypothetical protein